MVQKPAIQYKPIGVNIWQGKGQKKLAVVCHIAEGSLQGAESWFSNPAAQASSNFIVGLDGTIVCFVDPEGADAPFANGLINQPDAAVQALLRQTNSVNPNYWTVSIEHEGFSSNAMPAAQFAASTQLTAWLCQRFSIPPDNDHILGHYEFDDVTRHNCPGWSTAVWNQYEAAVQALLQPQPDTRIQRALALLQQAITILQSPSEAEFAEPVLVSGEAGEDDDVPEPPTIESEAHADAAD